MSDINEIKRLIAESEGVELSNWNTTTHAQREAWASIETQGRAWIKEFLTTIESLQKERDHYKASADQGWTATTISLHQQIGTLQKERDAAVSNHDEALKNFNAIKNEYFANKKLIESQKEEIEKNEDRFKELLRSRISEDNAKIWKLEAEVKSLKAITELKNEMLQDAEKRIMNAIESRDKLQGITEAAIKGLNEISEYPKGNDLVYVRDIKDKADNTIFEIERLQNV